MLLIITMEVSEVYGQFQAARAFRQLCLLHLVFQMRYSQEQEVFRLIQCLWMRDLAH